MGLGMSYFAVAGLLTGATFWAISRPDRRLRPATEIFR
jgi:hypothetical protein